MGVVFVGDRPAHPLKNQAAEVEVGQKNAVEVEEEEVCRLEEVVEVVALKEEAEEVEDHLVAEGVVEVLWEAEVEELVGSHNCLLAG